jgi:hypothetical protein
VTSTGLNAEGKRQRKCCKEVEFVTAEGRTIALLTLTQADIRPIGGREVLHVRELVQVTA